MVGYSSQELVTMTAQTLAPCVPARAPGSSRSLRAYADTVIRIRHADGWAMPALISDSVLIREDEKLAVVAFTDLTEIAWHSSPNDAMLPG